MKPGDLLLLTKPIGTGTLFAADMRQRAKGRWIDAALNSMLQSNRLGAQCFIRHKATACTDVTGFGLLGHLVEMTKASGVDVEIKLEKIPWLDGACETVAAGIFSSLHPQNIRLRRAIRNPEKVTSSPFYPLLFDPQTAGGLLASVSADQAEACLAELKTLGYDRAAMIGTVQPSSSSLEPISVVLTQ
jgi:selenide,water dikinase